MKTYRRSEVIRELVAERKDTLEEFPDSLTALLEGGFHGYVNMCDRELLECFVAEVLLYSTHGRDKEEFIYIGLDGKQVTVLPVAPAGLKIDGVEEDYKYY